MADALNTVFGWANAVWRTVFLAVLVLAVLIFVDIVRQRRWNLARDLLVPLGLEHGTQEGDEARSGDGGDEDPPSSARRQSEHEADGPQGEDEQYRSATWLPGAARREEVFLDQLDLLRCHQLRSLRDSLLA
jgi:hypothetical protein